MCLLNTYPLRLHAVMLLLLFKVFGHPLRLFEQEIPVRFDALWIGAEWQAHFRPKALYNCYVCSIMCLNVPAFLTLLPSTTLPTPSSLHCFHRLSVVSARQQHSASPARRMNVDAFA